MGKKRLRERQLRWYVESESDPTIHHWSFLIINEPREIDRITQRIKKYLAPTDSEQIGSERQIPNSRGLHYKLVTIDSHNPKKPETINLSNIYNGERTEDRNLYQHKKPDGLANYIDNLFDIPPKKKHPSYTQGELFS